MYISKTLFDHDHTLILAMANVHGEIVKSGKGVNLLFNCLTAMSHKSGFPVHCDGPLVVRGCGGRAHTDHSLPPVIVKIVDHSSHIPDEKLVASRLII